MITNYKLPIQASLKILNKLLTKLIKTYINYSARL